MSIKDNFSQAVKELWKKDGQDAKKPDGRPEGSPTELDKYLREPEQGAAENPAAQSGASVPLETPYYRAPEEEKPAAAQPAPEEPKAAAPQQNPAPAAGNPAPAANPAQQGTPLPRQDGYAQQNASANAQNGYNQNVRNIRSGAGQNNHNEYGGGYAAQTPNNFNQGYGGYIPPAQGGVPMQATNETEEITVISKNTVIDGNIRSLANMQIDGNIKGNVETTRNLDMSGKIIGDITCNNAGLNSAAMQGNMNLKGRLRMDRDTILIGDLSSQYADINGRVRGKLDIVGKAELKRDAIVFGDINASTIAVTDGAIIQGYVNTTFLSKDDSRNVFPDAISLDSKETKSE